MVHALDDIPVIGGLFKTPDAPEIAETKLAPIPDDASMRASRERALQRQGRSGRASTFLSDASTRLG